MHNILSPKGTCSVTWPL